MIGIINYGMGNLASVQNSLDFLGVDCAVFDDPAQIGQYDKLILPGVGAFGLAMENLNHSGFSDAIRARINENNTPLLGICLGMQLLLEESSEHGTHIGLGLIKGKVKSLAEKVSDVPIPHMGWNTLIPQKESVLLAGYPKEELIYYFVHGYYCEADDRSAVAATAEYGFAFDAVYEHGSLFGAQFHPEKSQRSGLHLLQNFAQL